MRHTIQRNLCWAVGLSAAILAALPSRLPADEGMSILIDDGDGALGRTGAPVSANVALSGNLLSAAREGRLQVVETTPSAQAAAAVPAQFQAETAGASSTSRCSFWLSRSDQGSVQYRVALKACTATATAGFQMRYRGSHG